MARHTGKRIAFCDTEYGTAFYGQEVAQRAVHPKAFDFDVLYTKSITEVLDAVRGLDPAVHGVIVIDSISHLWDACRNAYKGKLTKAGTIPLHAWSAIKKPYKNLMHVLLSSPLHVLICGRQGNDFAEDDESGEMKNLGYKMRAGGRDGLRARLLVRLEANSPSKKALAILTAHVERDRTGVLAGQSIPWPTFDNLAGPLLGLLGSTQASAPSDDEVGVQDAEALARGVGRPPPLGGADGRIHGTLRPGGDGDGTATHWRRAKAGGEASGARSGECTAGRRDTAGRAAIAGRRTQRARTERIVTRRPGRPTFAQEAPTGGLASLVGLNRKHGIQQPISGEARPQTDEACAAP